MVQWSWAMPLAGATAHTFRLGRGIQSTDSVATQGYKGLLRSHRCTSAFLAILPPLINYMFAKKSKKSPKPSRKHTFLGIPLCFRAELDTDPIGNRNRSCHDLAADRSESSIVMLDENNKSEDQGLRAPETSTPSDAIDRGTEHRNDPASERS